MVLILFFILFIFIFFSASFFISNLVQAIIYSIKHLEENSPLYTEAKELSERHAKRATIGFILSLISCMLIGYILIYIFQFL